MADRIYFTVAYEDKDQAKDLGARWDNAARKWFAPDEAVAQALADAGFERVGALPAEIPEELRDTPIRRTFFDVPFADKDRAKAVGARWDPVAELWFTENAGCEAALRELGFRRIAISDVELTELVGEDRTFGGNELTIDLLPRAIWGRNVHARLGRSDYARVRRLVTSRAGNCCELCGAAPTGPGMSAVQRRRQQAGGAGAARKTLKLLERWSYNNRRGVMKLRRLLCVCSDCELATRMGKANVQHRLNEACAQFARVNGVSTEQAKARFETASELWERRNQTAWTDDVSILTDSGLEVQEPEPFVPPPNPFAAIFGAMLGGGP